MLSSWMCVGHSGVAAKFVYRGTFSFSCDSCICCRLCRFCCARSYGSSTWPVGMSNGTRLKCGSLRLLRGFGRQNGGGTVSVAGQHQFPRGSLAGRPDHDDVVAQSLHQFRENLARIPTHFPLLHTPDCDYRSTKIAALD